MKEHPNFYETIAEAEMRLNQTIVMYDGEPYFVLCICGHKSDGILRMYLDSLSHPKGVAIRRIPGIPYEWYDEGANTRGKMMDDWLEKHPDEGVIRKMMNSPAFDKFRPFPLGMCNYNGNVIYVERQPTRHTQQGLTGSMLSQSPLTQFADPKAQVRGFKVDMYSPAFYQTIKGIYPTAKECLDNLLDPAVLNTGVGFSRMFAFVRGPLDLVFLAYKGDIIGVLPNADFSSVRLDKKFKYTKELVENLKLFNSINF